MMNDDGVVMAPKENDETELELPRQVDPSIAEQLVHAGLAAPEELTDIAAAFQGWAAHPDGWFLVPHGEVIAFA